MSRDLDERLNRISARIEDVTFLQNKGIGNEIGFYVFDYPPEAELRVREAVALVKTHAAASGKPRIVDVNLFELLLEILKERKVLNTVLKAESQWSATELRNKLTPLIRKDLVADHIAAASRDADVVFLTGVGSAYPLIRTHEILNNLHDKIDSKPLVVFFPGRYNLQELVLFGLLDANYYRAFRLVD